MSAPARVLAGIVISGLAAGAAIGAVQNVESVDWIKTLHQEYVPQPQEVKYLEDVRQACRAEIVQSGFRGGETPVVWTPAPNMPPGNENSGTISGELWTADNIRWVSSSISDHGIDALSDAQIDYYYNSLSTYVMYGQNRPLGAVARQCVFRRRVCQTGRVKYCGNAPVPNLRATRVSPPPSGPLELQSMPVADAPPPPKPREDEVPTVIIDGEYAGKDCVSFGEVRRYWSDYRHQSITVEMKAKNLCGAPIHTVVRVRRKGVPLLQQVMQMGSDVLPPGSHGWVGPPPQLGFLPSPIGIDFLLANSVVKATERAEQEGDGHWYIHFVTASCNAYDERGRLTAAFPDAELYHIECPTIPAF